MKFSLQGYEAVGFMPTNSPCVSPFFQEQHMAMNTAMGRGQGTIVEICNGLWVEMGDYSLKDQLSICYNTTSPFKISIILSGHVEFQNQGRGTSKAGSGSVWCVHGLLEEFEVTQFPRENYSSLSICLPDEFIESWLGVSCCQASKQLEKLLQPGRLISPVVKGLGQSSEIMRIAHALTSASRNTLADKLHFESLALDFLSQILTLEGNPRHSQNQPNKQIKAAADEAVDILRQEWNEPPTISSLARRVGINECYLKKGFRAATGISIGEYIRRQRMTKALELIETGYSVLDTAAFVGYSNHSHFSAAFRKFHGRLPSCYLPKAGNGT